MYSGTGIYSLSEAARLINVPARKMHRWLYGYTFNSRPTKQRAATQSYSPPLWMPQLAAQDFEAEVIGFNDLLEVRFVAAFVEHGVPLVVVRHCLETARTLLKIDYPMSSGSFKTDGKTIFAEALAEGRKQGALLDLRNRQFAFKDIIKPSLYAGIEYDGKRARRWYPQQGKRHIVLDPTREFGSPILDETGTPTSVLYASYLAEGATTDAIALTARIYDVLPRLVHAAVKYEESLKRPLH